MLTKKDVQLESFELSFIGGKIWTAAWGAAIPLALRDYFPRRSRGRSIYKVVVKGEFNTIKYLFYKRFFVSHEYLMSP